ncbi:tyrosine-protein phosphatase [Sphingomonas sp. KC8]|uniref:tyrosine-protein phosphatase n=1 Tax=Sphingomonas sp. KC8 TaxID=1030157 RepID=UPI0002488E7C|nr:tyrosine-protein phosphatase [Sphingomonas sp. KC8]ARS26247.1 protein-tyrosine phosphatase [Sphingomonas sp. KC8]
MRPQHLRSLSFALACCTATHAVAAPGVIDAQAFRNPAGAYEVTWKTEGAAVPVAVFVADKPDGAAPRKAVATNDRDGKAVIPAKLAGNRPYFHVVVDGGPDDPKRDGVWAAERVLPLQQASNFRDLGGYRTVDGKHVRWGMIYRSGAPAMLSPADLAFVDGLNIRTTIDLRSNEERRLTPSLFASANDRRTISHDYSMLALLPESTRGTMGLPERGGYGSVATTLAPLFKDVFQSLETADGAVHFHCSAGQDRAGMTAALILAALGVPRDVILKDYHLSTSARRPKYEMPPIDLAKHLNDPIAAFFAAAQKSGKDAPQPLFGKDGVSILGATFDMIDAQWGSVEGYLRAVVGLTDSDFARLRTTYLE